MHQLDPLAKTGRILAVRRKPSTENIDFIEKKDRASLCPVFVVNICAMKISDILAEPAENENR